MNQSNFPIGVHKCCCGLRKNFYRLELLHASFCSCWRYFSVSGFAQQLPNAGLLEQPPRPERAARCPAVDGWSTPAEKSCYRTTPRYAETMEYVRRIAQAAPHQVRIEKFGNTGEGRALVAVVVSRDGVFSPAALHRAKRPVVFIQNSIHAGEMDGKDASLALLRGHPGRPGSRRG